MSYLDDSYSPIISELIRDEREAIERALKEWALRFAVYIASFGQYESAEDFIFFASKMKGRINGLFDTMLRKLESALPRLISHAYEDGSKVVVSGLIRDGLEEAVVSIDHKLLDTLARDALHDFRSAIELSKERIVSFFKFSKQGVLTESQISEAIAAGFIDKGTPTEAFRRMLHLFDGKESTDTVKFFDGTEEINFWKKNLGLEKWNRIKDEIESLRRFRGIRIINKNGDYMRFTLKHYIEMVTRHHITNAQVMATIEQGNKNLRVPLFVVPGHSTTAKVCAPHEFYGIGKGPIYSTELTLVEWGIFEEANKYNLPGYHPVCSHRAKPYVMLDEQLYSFITKKRTKADADRFFIEKGLRIPEAS